MGTLADALFVMLVEQPSRHIPGEKATWALSQRKVRIRTYRIGGRSSPSVPEHGDSQAKCPSTSANWGLMRITALKREKVRFLFFEARAVELPRG
jgi:hypothetical protein